MHAEPLDETYFKWLYRQVAPVQIQNPRRTYWSLLRQLHNKEFVWFVPNDDNRVEDGKELRYEFLLDLGMDDVDEGWMSLGCSVLEMMIALSRRASFYTGEPADEWFWHMMDNLGLRVYNDSVQRSFEEVETALNRLVDRTYDEDGNGGLFPLRHNDTDQRKVEIWWQMTRYLNERG